jgi:hypothetical protein
MKSVLGLWSIHCVAYVVAFAFFLTGNVSKADLYAITTTTSIVTAVILSAWLLSEQAKVQKAKACLAQFSPSNLATGTVLNLSNQRLYDEAKLKIDEEFALMVELAQNAGTD